MSQESKLSQVPNITGTAQYQTVAKTLVESAPFQKAKQDLLQTIADETGRLRSIRTSSAASEVREAYLKSIQTFNKLRGRDLFFPFLASGLGSGPYVELNDGSVKLDMITGIGINFFGHSHPEFMAEIIDGVTADLMQGNLEPGFEAPELLKALLQCVGPESRLKQGWLTTCGTMANEIALKIIRQKRAPATKIIAFYDCFAGRSTAMQEITDNPGYRQGQPVYGEVAYVPFFDPKLGLEKSIEQTCRQMVEHTKRYPEKFAALMLELVQGEGGFNFAPKEYYVRVFELAKKLGLAVWADEIQTFGRTGEYFAFQTLGVSEFIDVATVAKMLQAAAVLYTEEYNPKPGLVAGTFSGSSVSLRAAKKTLELLESGGFLGKNGKIAQLSERFETNLNSLSQSTCKETLSDVRHIGGMIAFMPLTGTLDDVKAVLMKLFDLGVVAFYCGHGPYLIRMLPPLGAMKDADVDVVCAQIEAALVHVAQNQKVKTS